MNPLELITRSITPALAGWQSLVRSAESAVSDMGDAKYMLIAVGVLVILFINLRLARWLSASIKFDPPHHDDTHKRRH